ncbi:type I restriction enzyme HsdR N-terminal domain-containing protein [Agrobacterium rhizogenes]|uniref:type I restriction enzyme HsdR N-terminal domain-containing protein n=1 Tax=Rhizobium rhizogenes TaxID=359 RepID=UPI001571BA9D|nr:type I restriction enzyme HsdR N-terminal domain-containing protein [Rhizobium rhizogenes]NTI17043.1 type I restriction enzyme HsdR N-terminal domain-containing protein [Rhizobium rhizogenes]
MKIAREHVLNTVSSYNEAEVRFRIIDPVVTKLGYAEGDNVYLKLEEKLEYPYYYIGHKNKKKDLPVGFPDFRAGLKGARGSFIVEAKAANVPIEQKDIEQAHSYAAHAEVGAQYFVICNGLEIRVYETLSGPQGAPIVSLALHEIDERFHELENVLSPDNLARHCQVTYDLKLKLCEGLGSTVEIRSGIYDMVAWDYRIFINGVDQSNQLKPMFAQLEQNLLLLQQGFELKVAEGMVKRDEDGRINAAVIFSGATKNNQEAMKLIGLDRMTFSTSEQFLSTDRENPTVFESSSDFQVERGTKLPPLFGQAVPLDLNMKIDVFIKTRMYFDGEKIVGDYQAFSNYLSHYPGVGDVRLDFNLGGTAAIRLII